jgi:hypothetical protein
MALILSDAFTLLFILREKKDVFDERVVFVPSVQLLNLLTSIYKTWYVCMYATWRSLQCYTCNALVINNHVHTNPLRWEQHLALPNVGSCLTWCVTVDL